MTAKRLTKKLIRIFSIVLASLIVLLTAFHFWFVAHARELLENLVASRSQGKLRLEAGDFKFNWFSRKMELHNAVFYTTDTVDASTAYRFAVPRIRFKVKTVLPMIFEKRVLINLISLKDPDIIVTKIRPGKRDTLQQREDLSIPEEMGKIYNSIQDALVVLKVKKFEIENARFTLANRLKPEERPLVITRIDFHIDNFKVDKDESTGKEKILFSDNVVLKSRDQDILFPDGRHRLSFRKFRINIEKKIVEFDSCTIAALKTENSTAGFSIFFDELKMTDIDFDTLYRTEVIRADSVYCVNPQFSLLVDLDQRKAAGKAAPRLDRIIRQLTGDLYLNFVVVNNADFDITTVRQGKPSTFTSDGNNFEVQGLQLDNDDYRPLRVERFVMAIRNYENFLRDSAYVMKFDSIVVVNNQVSLNRFHFQQHDRGRVIKNFIVPRFQLTGLSWDDLLFENRLTARRAVLFNPVIEYVRTEKKQRKRSFYEVLSTLNEVMMLEDLEIINGDIDIRISDEVQMKLDDATLSIESRSLLGSEQLSGVRRSVTHLDFTRGFFRINDFTVTLNGINYTGPDSRMHAQNAFIQNSSRTVDGRVDNLFLDEIFINERTGDVTISGIFWQKAALYLGALGRPTRGQGASILHLKNIIGNNTQIKSGGTGNLTAFIRYVTAAELLQRPGQPLVLTELAVAGEDLSYRHKGSELSIGKFDLSDGERGRLEGLKYRNSMGANRIDLSIPLLTFIPDVASIIAKNLAADDIVLQRPDIVLYFGAEKKEGSFPSFRSNSISFVSPRVDFVSETKKGRSSLEWNGRSSENELRVSGFRSGTDGIFMDNARVRLSDFVFTGTNGKTFRSGRGAVSASVGDVQVKNNNDPAAWSIRLESLRGRNFSFDSLGKKAGSLEIEQIALQDLFLHSGASLRKLIAENDRFRLQELTGGYRDSMHVVNWYGVEYDRKPSVFTADSIAYRPALDRDSFVARFPYQVDYLQVRTGKITARPFDLQRHLGDSVFRIGSLRIKNVQLTDYRDNRPPFRAGIIKPLLTQRIRTIPVKLSLDTLFIDESSAIYTELNPKNNKTGVFPVTRINGKIYPVRNLELQPSDSMRLEATAYLVDTMQLLLKLAESYADTLSGFHLTARLRPTDIRLINPVLEPLASVRVRSGILDSLQLRVVGNDHLSVGIMEMRYRDLKVELLEPDSASKRRFGTAVRTAIANLIIRNRNSRRTGYVYFERNRDRSSLNYLIRMAMNGITSSIGVKRNKKAARRYKDTHLRNLPPAGPD
ncbi:MAG TPA: hypothetical protein VEB63_01125 [Chitinophagaceae bacterium]|nr:hypothetical protein [Chitinophagaceae bacterium]